MTIRIYAVCVSFVIIVLLIMIEGMFSGFRKKVPRSDQIMWIICLILMLEPMWNFCANTIASVNCVHDIVEGEVTECEVRRASKSDRFHTSYNFYLKEKDSGERIYFDNVFVKYLRKGMDVKLFVPMPSHYNCNITFLCLLELGGSTVRPRVIEIDGKETDLARGIEGMGLKARIVMFLVCLGFAIRHIRFSKRIYDAETIKKKGALFWNMGKYGLYIFYASLLFSVLINYQPRFFMEIVAWTCRVTMIGFIGYYIQSSEFTIQGSLKDLLFNDECQEIEPL